MTALVRFPNTAADFQRLTERQRRANIKAEREANLDTARAVLTDADAYSVQDVRAAIILLESRGDGRCDLLLAHQETHRLIRRERLARAEAARLAVETPADVAARHAHRWPALAVGSVLVALALLQASGWGL